MDSKRKPALVDCRLLLLLLHCHECIGRIAPVQLVPKDIWWIKSKLYATAIVAAKCNLPPFPLGMEAAIVPLLPKPATCVWDLSVTGTTSQTHTLEFDIRSISMPLEIDFHRRSDMNFRIAKYESFISQDIELIRICDYKPHDMNCFEWCNGSFVGLRSDDKIIRVER